MTDRILNSAWWLTIMAMIFTCAGAALLIGFRGMFDLLAMRIGPGTVGLVCSVAVAIATVKLCRHRDDLLI